MDEYAESQFKARVARRAEQLNMNVRAVYSDSGLSRDLKRTSIGHRTIDQDSQVVVAEGLERQQQRP